ncbi:MAG: MoaD/ThiS family protein [Gemmatimonadota bacterium]|nr:MoaD/ThiS family protein [Gemmatimonadota bacterium]
MITVELPKALCSYAGAEASVHLEDACNTVGDALDALGRRSPRALDRIMDERGTVRRHVNVFVNGESIRFLDGLATPAPDGSTILVLAAVSGG